MAKRVPVTLEDDQHKKISAAADAVGLTISAYLRFAALERVNSRAEARKQRGEEPGGEDG